MKIPVIIYSLRPVSMLSDFAQRKTNPKSEMTDSMYVHYVCMKTKLTAVVEVTDTCAGM